MIKEGSTNIVYFMTPRAGVLVLGHSHINHIVKMHYFYKNLLLYSQAQFQTTYLYSDGDHGRVYQNCKFHDPKGRGSCAKVWPYKSYSEMHYLFKNLLLYYQAQIIQTQYKEILTKEGSNFMIPRAWVLKLGVAIKVIIVNMYRYHLLLYQYTAH